MSQYFSILQVGYRSLLVHKLRSFLSVLGIVCGVMAVMSMISTGEGAKQEVLSQIEKMGLKNIYINAVKLSDEKKIQAREKRSYGLNYFDVVSLKGSSNAVSRIGSVLETSLTPVGTTRSITPKILSCTSNYKELLGLSILEGRFISEQDSLNKNLVCVLGNGLAKQLGQKGNVGQSIRINDLLYKIVGILTPYELDSTKIKKIHNENYNEILFLPLFEQNAGMHFSTTVSREESDLSQIIVEVVKQTDVKGVVGLIQRTLELTHNGVKDYTLVVPLELLNQSLKTQRVFNIILAVTGGISLLVGGIGIMNIMLATVTERKREIGIRRAVGARKKDIAIQFLTEAILLTVSGGLIGLAAGLFCVNIIENVAGWPIQLTVSSMLFPLILAFITGIFFGLYPAVKAARMDPIQNLKAL